MKYTIFKLIEDIAHWFQQESMVIFTYLLVFLAPIKNDFLGIGFLVVCDLFFGYRASKKAKNEAFKSTKIKPTIEKGLTYMAAILIAFICEKLFSIDTIAVKAVMGLIALREIKSIDEKIVIITGKSIFKFIFKGLVNKDEE